MKCVTVTTTDLDPGVPMCAGDLIGVRLDACRGR